eukprot:361466-Chlamydomonas_euryale.AAC.2
MSVSMSSSRRLRVCMQGQVGRRGMWGRVQAETGRRKGWAQSTVSWQTTQGQAPNNVPPVSNRELADYTGDRLQTICPLCQTGSWQTTQGTGSKQSAPCVKQGAGRLHRGQAPNN